MNWWHVSHSSATIEYSLLPWGNGSVCIFSLSSFLSPLNMWILTSSIHTCLDRQSLQGSLIPSVTCAEGSAPWPFPTCLCELAVRSQGSGAALSGYEQDCPKQPLQEHCCRKTGTDLVPQWRWGGWTHRRWRLLSCIVSKVRIYTHPFYCRSAIV